MPTTSAGGGERGYDGGKKVKGRQRHIAVGTLGLLLAVAVTAANVSDGRAAPALLGSMAAPTRASLAKVFADGRYNDKEFRRYLRAHPHIELEIKGRPPGARGFVLIRERWVVERTFARLGKYPRLVRDYEKRVRGSESRVKVAAIHGMLGRLTSTNGRGRNPNVGQERPMRKAA